MWSLHLTHMTFAKAGCPAFLFVVGAVACAAGLLFWPVEVIMVGFFTNGGCVTRIFVTQKKRGAARDKMETFLGHNVFMWGYQALVLALVLSFFWLLASLRRLFAAPLGSPKAWLGPLAFALTLMAFVSLGPTLVDFGFNTVHRVPSPAISSRAHRSFPPSPLPPPPLCCPPVVVGAHTNRPRQSFTGRRGWWTCMPIRSFGRNATSSAGTSGPTSTSHGCRRATSLSR